jgi:hypothetical protein
MADEILAIADDSRNDRIVRRRADGTTEIVANPRERPPRPPARQGTVPAAVESAAAALRQAAGGEPVARTHRYPRRSAQGNRGAESQAGEALRVLARNRRPNELRRDELCRSWPCTTHHPRSQATLADVTHQSWVERLESAGTAGQREPIVRGRGPIGAIGVEIVPGRSRRDRRAQRSHQQTHDAFIAACDVVERRAASGAEILGRATADCEAAKSAFVRR